MERVKIVNSNDYYLYKVAKVVVFGSYLSDKDRINDIDIAISLSGKYPQNEQIIKNDERIIKADKEGKVFASIFDQIIYPQHEVKMFLKSRSRALSFHNIDDGVLSLVGTTQKILYEE